MNFKQKSIIIATLWVGLVSLNLALALGMWLANVDSRLAFLGISIVASVSMIFGTLTTSDVFEYEKSDCRSSVPARV